MCNFSEGVMREGIKRERRQGRREGREEGLQEGRQEGRIEAIRNLAETMSLTFEQAMQVLKIPEAEQKCCLKMLQRNKNL